MLKLAKRNITELAFEVLEQAHWRPQEAQLCCKYKPAQSSEKEYQRLRRRWRQNEVIVNFSLDSLLMSVTPSDLSSFVNIFSTMPLENAFLVNGYSQILKKIIGVPDFVISDGESCVLGEIKIGAGYEITQFIKYQTFAMLCRATHSLPSSLTHLIVVQDTVPEKFLSDYGKAWLPEIINSELVLDVQGRNFVKAAMLDNIAKIAEKLKLARGISVPNVLTVDALKTQANELMNTVVVSWPEFVTRFDAVTGRTDLQPASSLLMNLGMGTFEIVMSC